MANRASLPLFLSEIIDTLNSSTQLTDTILKHIANTLDNAEVSDMLIMQPHVNILHEGIVKHVSASHTTIESIEIYRPSLVKFLCRCHLHILILPAFYDSYLPKLLTWVTSKRDSNDDIPAGMLNFLEDFLQFAQQYSVRRTWYPR